MTSLTKYPTGSVRELWFVSFPLMLSSLSLLFMVFCDRLFLARYSPSALSAAVTAGTAGWAVLGSFLILASMAEVFVAQYNGAKQYQRLGQPIWQMLWFAIVIAAVLVPLALWGGHLLFIGSDNFELENTYFLWLLIFGASFPFQAALAAFWVGRGKTRMVMLLAVAANAVNIVLDWIFIFGIEGWFPSLGIAGAAIATNIGNLFQTIIFFVLFLRSTNRHHYGTSRWNFNWKELSKVLRVGSPQATLFFIECIGWAIFYMMISHVGPEQIFVAGICQSVIILFLFAAEGIGRGAAAIAGNLIGAGRGDEAFKIFRAGLKIHVLFFLFVSLFLVVYPQPFIDLFISDTFALIGESGTPALDSLEIISMEGMIHALRVSLQLCLFYLLFEGIRWLISGILAAAGDTLFLLIAGTITVPIFLLLPNYLLVERLHSGVVVAFAICIEFSFVVSTIFLWRFLGRKWQKINLLA